MYDRYYSNVFCAIRSDSFIQCFLFRFTPEVSLRWFTCKTVFIFQSCISDEKLAYSSAVLEYYNYS